MEDEITHEIPSLKHNSILNLKPNILKLISEYLVIIDTLRLSFYSKKLKSIFKYSIVDHKVFALLIQYDQYKFYSKLDCYFDYVLYVFHEYDSELLIQTFMHYLDFVQYLNDDDNKELYFSKDSEPIQKFLLPHLKQRKYKVTFLTTTYLNKSIITHAIDGGDYTLKFKYI
jgi:hypothetical protein